MPSWKKVIVSGSSASLNTLDVTNGGSLNGSFKLQHATGSFSGSFSGVDMSFGITIDGGGSTITTGVKGDILIPTNAKITGWYILSTVAGSLVIDVWKSTFTSFPPTVSNTITGTEKPTLASSDSNSDTTLTTWTTDISANDVIRFNVDSVSSVKKVTLVITAKTI